MCWVAFDRAIRIAANRSFPAPLDRWTTERDRIYRAIHDKGWNEELQAFVQYEGSDVLDASLLLMPMMGFISPTDPRWLLHACRRWTAPSCPTAWCTATTPRRRRTA